MGDLQLNPLGNLGTMTDASNVSKSVNMYNVNIILENHSIAAHLSVGEFPSNNYCDVIIGMELIEHGKLLMENGKFAFDISKLK